MELHCSQGRQSTQMQHLIRAQAASNFQERRISLPQSVETVAEGLLASQAIPWPNLMHAGRRCATMRASEIDSLFLRLLEYRRTTGELNAMLDNLFTPTHLIIILIIALLVFGPRKLPELGKGLGEGLKGFKEGIKGIGGNNDAAQQQQQQTIAKVDAPQQPPATTQVK